MHAIKTKINAMYVFLRRVGDMVTNFRDGCAETRGKVSEVLVSNLLVASHVASITVLGRNELSRLRTLENY